MARIRTVKPEFWTSEQVAECTPIARLAFIGIWNFCDDNGIHPASIKRLAEMRTYSVVAQANLHIGQHVAQQNDVAAEEGFNAKSASSLTSVALAGANPVLRQHALDDMQGVLLSEGLRQGLTGDPGDPKWTMLGAAPARGGPPSVAHEGYGGWTWNARSCGAGEGATPAADGTFSTSCVFNVLHGRTNQLFQASSSTQFISGVSNAGS